MDRRYELKLDLKFKSNNPTMIFNEFDNHTSDFYIKLANAGATVDLTDAIIVLTCIRPDKTTDSQFIEVNNNVIYADLKPSMKSMIGTYVARAMLIKKDEKITTDIVTYEVTEDEIFGSLNADVQVEERYTLLTDMLSRLSNIELNEESRIENFTKIVNEFNTIKAEFNELIYVKVDERVDEVIKPLVDTKVELLTKPVISDLEDRVITADSKIKQVDNKLVEVNSDMKDINNQFDNKVTEVNSFIDQANKEVGSNLSDINDTKNTLVTNVSNKLNEVDLKIVEMNDTKDNMSNTISSNVSDMTSKVDSKIIEVNNAKTSMTSTVSNKITEVNNATSSMNNQFNSKVTEVNNKITEVNKAKVDMIEVVDTKTAEVEVRFNKLTSSQQQDSEVIDARGEHTSLRERLEQIENNPNIIWETVEG